VAIEFTLPELGENIESGDLVRVMVAPGETVSNGQPVVELETDKAVIEVPSTLEGKVQEVRVKQGEKLRVGQVIFTLENDGAGAAVWEQADRGGRFQEQGCRILPLFARASVCGTRRAV